MRDATESNYEAIEKLFVLKSKVPTSFDSIPVLNPQNATTIVLLMKEMMGTLICGHCLFQQYDKNPISENKENVSHYFDIVNNQGKW